MFRIFAGLILLIASVSARAIPVVWTLDNAIFDDGGIATGSFVYDADLNVYSDIDISTTDGTDLAGQHYQYSAYEENEFDIALGVTDVEQADLTGASVFLLAFGEPLKNAGGSVSLFDGFGLTLESVCAVSDCRLSVGEPNLRHLVSGSVSGTAVPIPAAVWLFGSALFGLSLTQRKKFFL